MTPIYLSKAIKEELERLFDGFFSSGEAGYNGKKVSIFEQALPLNHAAEEEDFMPYIIIRIMDGEIGEWGEAESVKVILIFCTSDAGMERSGHEDIMNMMQKVKERIARNPQIGAFFTAELPVKWVVQDDDTYPIYYGGMELVFDCPAIRRESRFA